MTPAIARDAPLPETGSYVMWDTRTRYLGLRVHAGGSKIWIVQKKLGKAPCRVSLGAFPSLTHAAACGKVADVVAQISKGIDPNLEKRKQIKSNTETRNLEAFTVTRCFEEYIKDKTSSGNPPKPLTQVDWQRSLARIKSGSLGSLPLVELTGGMLAEYYDTAAKQAKRLTTNGGRTQAGRDLRYLRAAYKLCAVKFALKLPDQNPFEALNTLRDGWYLVKSKTRIIGRAEDDLRRWWRAVEALRPAGKPHKSRDVLADYLQLSLLWGGRRGELLSLKWESVSLADDLVSIAGADTKNQLEHVIPITRYARQLLEKRHRLNSALAEPSPWVFPSHKINSQGVHSHIVSANSAIRAVEQASGFDFSAHDLRRTFGTLFNETGASEYTVKRALNHAAHDTASKHYIKSRIATLRPMYQQYEDNLLIEAGVLAAVARGSSSAGDAAEASSACAGPQVSISAEEFARFQDWLAATQTTADQRVAAEAKLTTTAEE